MSKKRNTERYIKSTVKRYFKRINKEKEYTFLILLGIFTTLVLYNPTFEKVLIYISSLIAIQIVMKKDNDVKMKKKLVKKNINDINDISN